MSRGYKALTILIVAALGLWGCAQGQGPSAAQAEKVRALESKIAKLEDDYRAVVAARDGLRKKVAALEEEQAKNHQELEAHQPLLKERLALLKDREELQQQLGSRTTERDEARTQLEGVRKGLRSLLGQADAAAARFTPPDVAISVGNPAGKS